MMSTIRTTHPVARKDYRCEDCDTVIPKGERHACGCQAWEGSVVTWRAHEDCLLAAADVCDRTDDDPCERSPLYCRIDDYPEEMDFIRENYPNVAARIDTRRAEHDRRAAEYRAKRTIEREGAR